MNPGPPDYESGLNSSFSKTSISPADGQEDYHGDDGNDNNVNNNDNGHDEIDNNSLGNVEPQEAVLDYELYRDEFYRWMAEELELTMKDDLINKLDQIMDPKINSTQELYEVLRRDSTKTLRIALRDFFKFLLMTGKRTELDLINFKAIVKIPSSGIRTGSQVFTETHCIIQARERIEDDEIRSLLVDIIVYSGLRLQEAVDILNNFEASELYINEHFARYDLLAMYKRIGSKKAGVEVTKREVVAYMPVELAKKLRKMEVNYNTYKTSGRKKNRPNKTKGGLAYGIVTASQIRKWFSNTLDDLGVEEKIINFITGKTPMTVLRRSYLDLLKKADKVYPEILEGLEEEFEKGVEKYKLDLMDKKEQEVEQ